MTSRRRGIAQAGQRRQAEDLLGVVKNQHAYVINAVERVSEELDRCAPPEPQINTPAWVVCMISLLKHPG